MPPVLSPWLEQRARWPQRGRHILAQYDDSSVVVYQAYRPAIGRFAAEHQYFGGEFSLGRMSWIKPNFLWMMHRCGWATKEGQEVVLAVRLQRSGFDRILAEAVHSTHVPELYGDASAWKRAVAGSDVRLQWDPDHDPHGQKQERRAIQLGLRGDILRRYARDWIVSIDDVTPVVRAQHDYVRSHTLDQLQTPTEAVYPVSDAAVAARLQIDA